MTDNGLAALLYQAVGQQIAEVRRSRKPLLTQQQLAELTEGRLSRSAIANIESGRQRIALHHLYELALALRVEPRSLLPPTAEFLSHVPGLSNSLAPDPAERAFLEMLAVDDLHDASSIRREREAL